MESQKCTSKLRNEFLVEADRELGKILDERHSWKMNMQKKMCSVMDQFENKDGVPADKKKPRSAGKSTQR
jgi:hypothetical protein